MKVDDIQAACLATYRPLLLHNLHEDDVQLGHEDALAPENLLIRRLLDHQVNNEILDPRLDKREDQVWVGGCWAVDSCSPGGWQQNKDKCLSGIP